MTRLPDPNIDYRIGNRYTYRWDHGFAETERYDGEPMLILRHADAEEVDPMYTVRFSDGTEQDVYLDEVGAALGD